MMCENTLEQTQRRPVPRTAWKPGQSGNPGGRPRELADVKLLAREHTTEAIETLVADENRQDRHGAGGCRVGDPLSRLGQTSLPIQHETGIVMTSEQMASLKEALGLAANRRDNATTMSR